MPERGRKGREMRKIIKIDFDFLYKKNHNQNGVILIGLVLLNYHVRFNLDGNINCVKITTMLAFIRVRYTSMLSLDSPSFGRFGRLAILCTVKAAAMYILAASINRLYVKHLRSLGKGRYDILNFFVVPCTIPKITI